MFTAYLVTDKTASSSAKTALNWSSVGAAGKEFSLTFCKALDVADQSSLPAAVKSTVQGTNKWDGGWDGSTFIVEAELTADCYGVVFQMVFGANPEASYKIRSIDIE